jgi:hypothetical protein
MDGAFAQVIAIATHGSAWLRDPSSVDLDDFAAHNSTFRYVGELTFFPGESVRPWLETQAANGIERIWLSLTGLDGSRSTGPLPPHIAIAFAGGSHGGLLTVHGRGRILWESEWAVGDRDAPDRRIWHVTYGGRETTEDPRRPDVDGAAGRLVAALEAARGFAQGHGLGHWPGVFDHALRCWTEPGVGPKYHADLFPPGRFDEKAVRLASMAQMANVFGGMGSWNDVGVGDGAAADDYQAISRELYAAMLEAFLASVNSDLVPV